MSEITFLSNWIDKSQAVEQQPTEEIKPVESKAKPKKKTTKAKPKATKTAKPKAPRAKKTKVVTEDVDEPEIKQPIIKEVELTNEISPAKEEPVNILKDMKISYEQTNNNELHDLLQQHIPKRDNLFDFNKKKSNYSQLGYIAGIGLLVSFLL